MWADQLAHANQKVWQQTESLGYHVCGINGCVLADRHPGDCLFPETTGRRRRTTTQLDGLATNSVHAIIMSTKRHRLSKDADPHNAVSRRDLMCISASADTVDKPPGSSSAIDWTWDGKQLGMIEEPSAPYDHTDEVMADCDTQQVRVGRGLGTKALLQGSTTRHRSTATPHFVEHGVVLVCKETETPCLIAARLSLPAYELVKANLHTYPDIKLDARMRKGSMLKLPRSAELAQPAQPGSAPAANAVCGDRVSGDGHRGRSAGVLSEQPALAVVEECSGVDSEEGDEDSDEEGEDKPDRDAELAAAALLLRLRGAFEYEPTVYHELIQVMHLRHADEISTDAASARARRVLQVRPQLLRELETHVACSPLRRRAPLVRAALALHGSVALPARVDIGAATELGGWLDALLTQQLQRRQRCMGERQVLKRPSGDHGGGGSGGDDGRHGEARMTIRLLCPPLTASAEAANREADDTMWRCSVVHAAGTGMPTPTLQPMPASPIAAGASSSGIYSESADMLGLNQGEMGAAATATFAWAETPCQVRWVYPSTNASKANSWVGLFAEGDIVERATASATMTAGAALALTQQPQQQPLQQMLPPPGAVRVCVCRQVRYRMISKEATRGETRFLPWELCELPNGTYRFALMSDDVALATSQSIEVHGGVIRSVSTLAGLVTAEHGTNNASGSGGSSGPRRAMRVPEAGRKSSREDRKSAQTGGGGGGEEYLSDVPLVEVTVLGEVPHSLLLKAAYRCIDRHSYLDWGLTSDYDPGVTEKRFREGSRREAARGYASLAEGAFGLRAIQAHRVSDTVAGRRAHGFGGGGNAGCDPKSNEPRGLGGNTKGSEGYGEVTQGSLQRLCCLLSSLREHILGRLHGSMGSWPRAWDLRSESSLVDVGSGYGKAVRSPRHTPRLKRHFSSRGPHIPFPSILPNP